MGVFVLMMLITLSVSMVAIILAAVALSQASRAARAALEVEGPRLAEGDKQRMSEAAEKIDALNSRIDEFGNKAGEAAGRLDKLEAGLDTARQEIEKNAACLAETDENLVHFKEFRGIVEATHRRISDAFSFTQDTEAEDVDLAAEEGLAEPEEGPADSDPYDDSIRPPGEYDDRVMD